MNENTLPGAMPGLNFMRRKRSRKTGVIVIVALIFYVCSIALTWWMIDGKAWNRCYRLSQTKIRNVVTTGQTERFGDYVIWAGPKWKPGSPQVFITPKPFNDYAGAGANSPIKGKKVAGK